MTDQRRLDVAEREQAVFHYLRAELIDIDEGATAPAIYRHMHETGYRFPGASAPTRDQVTVPVYYKLLKKLVGTGHLIELEDSGPDGQRYALARHLHADTALTLDDLRELERLPPTSAIAKLMDAREYLRSRRDTVIKAAAEQLLTVHPVELAFEMIRSKLDTYNLEVDIFIEAGASDDTHRQRLKAARTELDQMCYRWFGLSHQAVSIPATTSSAETHARYDAELLREQLATRIYGDTFLRWVPHTNESTPADWSNVTVAGSDGSTYSSIMQVDTASTFTDASGAEVVTFNNSVVYLRMEGELARQHKSPWYSVPLTRSAIDSPRNSGMVMAPFMYFTEGLNESEYEHMTKCATDVVQWRADEQVFRGHGRSIGAGHQLPEPLIHFRDGTVTLQERESNHYQRIDSYGELVREGVRLSHDILQHLTSRRRRPVFAGAVKSSQLHLFATLVNWFIGHGSHANGFQPVDPNWDMARGAMLADNEAMSTLLSSLGQTRDAFAVTCVVVRPFHALTDLYRYYTEETPEFWTRYFQQRQADSIAATNVNNYWKTVDSIEDDPYVRMMETGDYALFYIGHSHGDPTPLAPRYEFLEQIRGSDLNAANDLIDRNVKLIVTALRRTGFSLDQDHNFMSRKRLVKHVPFVIYEAHEKCKALGRLLESELRSMVVHNLQRLRRGRGGTDNVRFRPMPIIALVKRHQQAIEPGSTDTDSNEPV